MITEILTSKACYDDEYSTVWWWSGNCFNGQDIAVMIRILFCWSGSCCDGNDLTVVVRVFFWWLR